MEVPTIHLKGTEKLREKLPDYPGKKILRFALMAFLAASTGLIFTQFFGMLAQFFPVQMLIDVEPVLPILGFLLCQLIGMKTVWGLWTKRDELLAQSKEKAYQRAFPRAAIGIPLVLILAVKTYPSLGLLMDQPMNQLTIDFNQTLWSIFIPWIEIEIILKYGLGFFFLILGLLTVRRSLITFGIDYMAVVYLYYPDESEIQDHEIYSVIRHPAYFGVSLLSVGGLLMTLSPYSVIYFLMFIIGFLYHTFRVEEKELIERFGESYVEYRKQVPGIYVKPKQIVTYLRFLAGKSKE